MELDRSSWSPSSIVLVIAGVTLIGTGIYFLFLRPPLLPEDIRYMALPPAQFDILRPLRNRASSARPANGCLMRVGLQLNRSELLVIGKRGYSIIAERGITVDWTVAMSSIRSETSRKNVSRNRPA